MRETLILTAVVIVGAALGDQWWKTEVVPVGWTGERQS